MGMNYYKDRVVLNVLGGSVENARECYEAAEGHAAVGVLTADYPSVDAYIKAAGKYMDVLEGNLSVGLGGGNPAQWRTVAEVAKTIKAHHFNQAFCAVGWTRANVGNDECHINSMVAPSGIPGLVKISTGPLSCTCEKPALVDVDTCIAMVKEMGGNSLKFFPMGGLKVKDELAAVAAACARQDFILVQFRNAFLKGGAVHAIRHFPDDEKILAGIRYFHIYLAADAHGAAPGAEVVVNA